MKMNSNLKRDVIMKEEAFTSVENDTELIVNKLFIENKLVAKKIKSLLLVPHKNCLTEIDKYSDLLNSYNISDLVENDFLRFSPKMTIDFNGENQTVISISPDLIAPNPNNPEYTQYAISIFCMCNLDVWTLNGYKQRPLRLAGIIKGVLSGAELTGIGRLKWMGTSRITVDEKLGGYVSTFMPIITEQEDRINHD